MNKQQLNKTYYQTHQELIKTRQKARYHAQKEQNKTQSKNKTSEYYRANNIQILLSLKDYLESNAEKMKLWYRFSSVLTQIKESVSDIVEIMRLREVMEDLITDYWTTAKKHIRLTKSWNKLTFAQQQAKKNLWAKQLAAEEKELLAKLSQEEIKQKKKIQVQNNKKQIEINAYWNQTTNGKLACPECGKMVKELNEENNMCNPCVKKYSAD